MATIAALPNNNSLVAAFQCTTSIEGAVDQHIRLSKSHDDGKTWSDPVPIIGYDNKAPVWGQMDIQYRP
jgi:hypothetical protein